MIENQCHLWVINFESANGWQRKASIFCCRLWVAYHHCMLLTSQGMFQSWHSSRQTDQACGWGPNCSQMTSKMLKLSLKERGEVQVASSESRKRRVLAWRKGKKESKSILPSLLFYFCHSFSFEGRGKVVWLVMLSWRKGKESSSSAGKRPFVAT